MEKNKILSHIKRLLSATAQFSGHHHTILINEYQQSNDVIMSKPTLIRINFIE